MPDVPAFFNRQLIVEPGTRALMIEDGQYLGEIPAGTYTLERFAKRLNFWNRKQATVVLTRQEEQLLTLTCPRMPTLENLVVDVSLQITIQLQDVGLFLQNLLGAKRNTPRPNSGQSCGSWCSPCSGTAWPGRRSRISPAGSSVATWNRRSCRISVSSLERYGLRFGQVRMISIYHEKLDEHRRKVGEVWPLKEEVEHKQALDEIYSADEMRKIRRLEKTQELELLAQQTATNRMEGDLGVMLRRIGIRDQWRDAIRSDKFSQIKDEEEFARMLLEQDKGRLIRQTELEELTTAYRTKHEDCDALRTHLLHKIEIEREVEIGQLRMQLQHDTKVKALEFEIDLARRVESEQNRRWREGLERAKEQADVRRRQQIEEIMHQRRLATDEGLARREDDWQRLLHEQRTSRLQGDITFEETERRSRVERLEADMRTHREEEQLTFNRRRAEFERETSRGVFEDQMMKLTRMNELNRESESWQREAYQRKTRFDREMEEILADKAAERQRQRLAQLANIDVRVLIAETDVARGSLLLDLEKTRAEAELAKYRASEETKQKTGLSAADKAVAEHKAQAALDAKAEQERLLQQMIKQVQDASQQGTAAMQKVLETMVGAIGQVAQGPGHQPVLPSMMPTQGPAIVQCPNCRAENPVDKHHRFCCSCGKQL